MVTNDDRKRVSTELRQYAKKFATPTWRVLCNIVLGADSRHQSVRKLNLLDRLADLIDPDGGHDAEAGKSSDPAEQGVESIMEWLRGFGGVDRDVLLKLADEMADDADSCIRSARLAADEGDRKMAVLFASIADGYIEGADRIRSALGVSRGDQQKA